MKVIHTIVNDIPVEITEEKAGYFNGYRSPYKHTGSYLVTTKSDGVYEYTTKKAAFINAVKALEFDSAVTITTPNGFKKINIFGV